MKIIKYTGGLFASILVVALFALMFTAILPDAYAQGQTQPPAGAHVNADGSWFQRGANGPALPAEDGIAAPYVQMTAQQQLAEINYFVAHQMPVPGGLTYAVVRDLNGYWRVNPAVTGAPPPYKEK